MNKKKQNRVVPMSLTITNDGARGVMVIVVGNGHGDASSNLDETDCISHSTNTQGKGMNPIILPPAMGGQTEFFSLGEATSLGEGKLWIQTC